MPNMLNGKTLHNVLRVEQKFLNFILDFVVIKFRNVKSAMTNGATQKINVFVKETMLLKNDSISQSHIEHIKIPHLGAD